MKILLVEDELRISAALKKGLEQEKYVVDVAYDGATGYDLATSNDYDLMILDLLLPEMDGLSVCKKLRENKNTTRILMLTAKGQISDRVHGLEAGADDYLTKPFSFEELLARIKAVTRRPKELKGKVLEVEGLSLNYDTFKARRCETEIELSSKEFLLLEYMMRNKGKVLNKQNIIDHVWDYDADILPNTVEVFIKNLRSKIDQPFKERALIHTVRGFGYKLE